VLPNPDNSCAYDSDRNCLRPPARREDRQRGEWRGACRHPSSPETRMAGSILAQGPSKWPAPSRCGARGRLQGRRPAGRARSLASAGGCHWDLGLGSGIGLLGHELPLPAALSHCGARRGAYTAPRCAGPRERRRPAPAVVRLQAAGHRGPRGRSHHRIECLDAANGIDCGTGPAGWR